MSEAASDYAIYRQVVTQLMSGEEQLPSLPTITLDIRRALSDPEVTLVQLSRLISRDPALSAILMKYASSALLRTQQPPKSLLDVLRVLGMAQEARHVEVGRDAVRCAGRCRTSGGSHTGAGGGWQRVAVGTHAGTDFRRAAAGIAVAGKGWRGAGRACARALAAEQADDEH